MTVRTRTPPHSHLAAAAAISALVVSLATTHAQQYHPQQQMQERQLPGVAAAPARSSSPTASASAALPSNTATPPTGTGASAPSAFIGVASAASDQAILYHGGQLNEATVQFSNELISLDVTKSWPISSPAWTNLTIPSSGSGGPAVSGHSATMSKDLSTLFITAPTGNVQSPFLYEYSIKAGTWSTVNAPAAQAVAWSSRKDAQFLTDPATGALWFLGGAFANGAESNEVDKFLNGFWNANIAITSPSDGSGPGATATMNKFSSGTSHIYGSKIYLFGGLSMAAGSRSYQSFQSLPWIDISTATPTIGYQLTMGPVPPSRQDHCSVLTVSQKVIIFGGYDTNSKTTFQDIWSLDLVTLTWQQVLTVNPTSPRFGHNCNIIGANMIVFGGRDSGVGTEIGYYKDVQVYDVMSASWMTTYAPKQDTTPITQQQPAGVGSGGSSGPSGGLSKGALIGVIVGVVALIGCLVGIVVYRRRQKRIEIREAEMEKEAYLASLGFDAEADEDGEHGQRRNYMSHRYNPYVASAGSPHSGSTRRLNGGTSTAANTPGMSHYGLSGIESPALSEREGQFSYGMPSEAPGNVQYLMQQLPDGTIAVQPVYLNHQPSQLQHSPNMIYSETSSLGGFLGSPKTPGAGPEPGARAGVSRSPSSGGYFAPPPPPNIHNTAASSAPGTAPADYMPPPSMSYQQGRQNSSTGAGASHIPLPPPTHDPFASPVLPYPPSSPKYQN